MKVKHIMTTVDEIKRIESQILRLENNPDNVVGGIKAWNSGYEIQYKKSIESKLAKLNKQLDKLYDLCEA